MKSYDEILWRNLKRLSLVRRHRWSFRQPRRSSFSSTIGFYHTHVVIHSLNLIALLAWLVREQRTRRAFITTAYTRDVAQRPSPSCTQYESSARGGWIVQRQRVLSHWYHVSGALQNFLLAFFVHEATVCDVIKMCFLRQHSSANDWCQNAITSPGQVTVPSTTSVTTAAPVSVTEDRGPVDNVHPNDNETASTMAAYDKSAASSSNGKDDVPGYLRQVLTSINFHIVLKLLLSVWFVCASVPDNR
jgi:hypothetical protein